jgi:hypothetical protein
MSFATFAFFALHLTHAPADFRLNDSNSFPFIIGWDDAVKGTATDASFLNQAPAGKNGYIIVKEGVFVEEKTGKRVKFFGTNCGTRAAFPLKEEAPAMAAHMAKLGINIVRFHHLQNDWDVDGGMMWKRGREQIEFDPIQIDRLDYFIAELKKVGIYTNMNLQTTRKMIPALGFPESTLQIPDFQKKVDKMDDKMIALQKQYAKDLLDRVNPYTKLKYKDDPAIMVIEINNENSLCGWPGESPGAGLEKWPEPFQSMLRSKWNTWLKAKYKTDEMLAKAWPSSDNRSSASITTPSNKWTTENITGEEVKFEEIPSEGIGAPTLKTSIVKGDGTNWHIQTHLAGLNLVNGKTYTVEFEGKADRNIALGIGARLDISDWRFLGLGSTVALTTAWKKYQLSFTVGDTLPNHSRVGFMLGDTVGTTWIKAMTIREGSVTKGAEKGESIAKGNVGIPSTGATPMYRDYATFLVETEKQYDKTMRDYLVKDLGFTKANIINSQIAWGGLTSIVREEESSFADNHEYWNHPQFIGGDWNPKNYKVNRSALVNNMDGGTLWSLSNWRVKGKPYSISEYDHPAPSDYVCEMMPLYSNVAALQDWNVIYTFAYLPGGKREKNDQIDGFFDNARNPAKVAFYPASAILFRLGLLASDLPTAFAPVSKTSWQTAQNPNGLWSGQRPEGGALDTKVGLSVGADKVMKTMAKPASRRVVSGADGRKIVTVENSKVLSITGFVGGQMVACDAGNVRFGNTATDFASMMLVPIDGADLKKSKRMLLTVVGRAENTNMGWNEARDSVSDQWGTAPIRAEIVPVTFDLKGFKATKVSILDSAGKLVRPVKTLASNGGFTFEIGKGTRAVYYEISQ